MYALVNNSCVLLNSQKLHTCIHQRMAMHATEHDISWFYFIDGEKRVMNFALYSFIIFKRSVLFCDTTRTPDILWKFCKLNCRHLSTPTSKVQRNCMQSNSLKGLLCCTPTRIQNSLSLCLLKLLFQIYILKIKTQCLTLDTFLLTNNK